MDILQKGGSMPIGRVTELLSRAYISLIKADIPVKRFPSVMLWGPPGVGKSQGVRQIAAEIKAATGKKVAVTDVRLLLFNPVDLRGIPTANAEKTLAVWLKPKIFQMDDGRDTVNILFLDEISAAPQSVQAAAYQITLDRTVGEHRLPENCIVIAAGNRVTDRSVAYHMPKALANRLCHIEIESHSAGWAKWAANAGIHSMVCGFIDHHPSLLMRFDAAEEDLAFPTPRSWEMVSNILTDISDDVRAVFPLIVGCVGRDAANQLLSWSNVYRRVPDMQNIFSGKETVIPRQPDVLYALSAKMTAHIREHHSNEEVKNAVAYVSKLPPEFQSKIFGDMLTVKEILLRLYNNVVFDHWFQRAGRSWDAYGL